MSDAITFGGTQELLEECVAMLAAGGRWHDLGDYRSYLLEEGDLLTWAPETSTVGFVCHPKGCSTATQDLKSVLAWFGEIRIRSEGSPLSVSD